MAKSVQWGDAMAYKRKERSGFMIAHRSRIQLNYLSEQERGQILMALLDYSENGILPQFSGVLGMAFDTMAEQVDFYSASYNARCETNSRNRKTIVDDHQPPSTMVDDGDQTKQNKSKLKQNIPPKSPKGDVYTPEFLKFWELYPKKRAKAGAAKAFAKAIQKTDIETMLQALEQQKSSPDWQKDDGQFIPLPSSWLNGCRWEDEATTVRSAYTYARQPDILPEYND